MTLYWLLCLVLPVGLGSCLLWRCSIQFRFLVKICSYYVSIGIVSFFASCLALRTPSDPENMRTNLNMLNWITAYLNITYEVRGIENVQTDGPAVVIGNHQSSLDFKAMGLCWPWRCVPVVKHSFSFIPGLNILMWLSGAIFINRYNTQMAKNTLKHTVDEIRRKNLKVWIFPEGTRNHQEGMLPFKKGAFHVAVQAQIPIIPIVFSSIVPFYCRKTWRFQNDGLVIVQALPSISTEGLTSNDVQGLMDRAREVMLTKYNEITDEVKKRYAERDF